MEENIRVIIEKKGCEEGQARLALALCSNDLEKTLDNFESIMYNHCIIKARLVSKTTHVYGLVMAIIDISNRQIPRLASVLTKNQNIYTNLKGNWFVFERKLYAIRLGEECLHESTQELDNLLFDKISSDKSFFDNLKNEKYDNIEEQLIKFVNNIDLLQDAELSIYVDRSGKKYAKPSINHFSFREKKKTDYIDNNSNIELQVNLLNNNTNAISAKFLLPGDRVMTEVVDEREVAGYISKLLGGKKGDIDMPISAVIENVSRANNTVTIRVRFSPGITGVAYMLPNESVRLVGDVEFSFIRKIRKFFIDIKKKIIYNN